ncbi:anti-sigma factor family protein [Spirillospora sp. NBC_01491]|uniref:anti-sigma factor family protein n=1 Tax=Spirillospora sp. NBC_01491 TaxID=2976007 RepID=UPI002E35337A|nr:zf-HC2 domain-containing protein [Spirillospora sp. NBC_01491]
MSCLGERLTALVDGELGHEERDRALAHLAACARCRTEADELRRLKSRLRSLSDLPPSDGADALPSADFLTRLRSLGEAAEPEETTQPTRPLRSANRPARPAAARPTAARPAAARPAATRPTPAARPRDNRPAARPAAAVGQARRQPRRRYLAVGAATLFLGLGTVSYVAGGGQEAPTVTPAFDRFAVEHALTSGDSPLTDPLTDPGEQIPVQAPPEP